MMHKRNKNKISSTKMVFGDEFVESQRWTELGMMEWKCGVEIIEILRKRLAWRRKNMSGTVNGNICGRVMKTNQHAVKCSKCCA